MIQCFQIEKIIIPKLFLFDTIHLSAKFTSSCVHLSTLKFNSQQFTKQRNINLNIQLKIPTSRNQFTLILEVKIINMQTDPSEVLVDMELLNDYNKFQFVFQTDLGRVLLHINAIEEIYLPKQLVSLSSSNQKTLANNSQDQQVDRSSSLIEKLQIHHNSNDEILNHLQKGIQQTDKSLTKRHNSSKLKSVKKAEKLTLSRSQYMKIEVDQSLLASDHANAETDSELKGQVKKPCDTL